MYHPEGSERACCDAMCDGGRRRLSAVSARRLAYRYEWNATEVAQATSFMAVGGMRNAGAGCGVLQPPLHLAAIHAARASPASPRPTPAAK